MKKIFMLFLAVSFSLFGCGQNETKDLNDPLNKASDEPVDILEGVTMTFKPNTVSSEGGTIIFENETDEDYMYGDYYNLETKRNGEWVQVPLILKSYGFNDIGYSLNSTSYSEWPVEWEWLYGKLTQGEYRLIKDVIDDKEFEDYNTYYLTAEFTLD